MKKRRVKRRILNRDISNRATVIILIIVILVGIASLFVYLDVLNQTIAKINTLSGADEQTLPEKKVGLQIIVAPEPGDSLEEVYNGSSPE